MTIFHIRRRLASLCNPPPQSPTLHNNKVSPFTDASQHLAHTTTLAIQPPKFNTHPAPPKKETSISELPHELLRQITLLVNDLDALKNLSVQSKQFRQLAIERRYQLPYSLDDLVHLQDAHTAQQHTQTLHIDPALDQASLSTLGQWELPALKHLQIGQKLSRAIKYSRFNLELPASPVQAGWSLFSSTLLNEYPALQKIDKLTFLNLTALKEDDDFSTLRQCPNLREVHFGSTQGGIGNKLNNLSRVPHLDTLTLHSTAGIAFEDIPKLSQFENLKTLTLDACFGLKPQVFEAISLCPKLEHLGLHDAMDKDVMTGLEHLMTHSTSLKSIECKRLHISPENAKILQHLATQHNVQLNIQRIEKKGRIG